MDFVILRVNQFLRVFFTSIVLSLGTLLRVFTEMVPDRGEEVFSILVTSFWDLLLVFILFRYKYAGVVSPVRQPRAEQGAYEPGLAVREAEPALPVGGAAERAAKKGAGRIAINGPGAGAAAEEVPDGPAGDREAAGRAG